MARKSKNGAPRMGRDIGRPQNPNYYCHDDRDSQVDGEGMWRKDSFYMNKRRVAFSDSMIRSSSKKYHKNKNLHMAIKQHFDDDVTMGENANNNGRPVVIRGHRGGSFKRGGPGRNYARKGMNGHPSWYKVTIPYASKYTKEYVIKSLLTYMSPNTFTPIMYKIVDKDGVFYLDNEEDSTRLLDCDKKITSTDGYKIHIRVIPGYPNLESSDITEGLKEKIKIALEKRYVHETNALNLTRFHLDSELVSDYFCALFRPNMMNLVLDIISTHIPQLQALNLDANRLIHIGSLSTLKDNFPNLKILYIGDNKIKEINQLDNIKQLELQELRLEGNPVCSRYKSRQNDYVSAVQKRFPKLQKLDGKEIPKSISFDLETESKKLPPTQMLFTIDENSKNIASQFLVEYFRVFDSGNRQDLLNAYHEQAIFSMTVSSKCNPQKLNDYVTDNRNLLKCNDSVKRRKLLKSGRLAVASYMSTLPKSQHIVPSFTMDISLVTKEMMMVTVTGLFRELSGKDDPLRFFNRTFVIVPHGSGYCICNEQMHISCATDVQEKQFRQIVTPQVPVTVANQDAVPTSSAVSAQDMECMAITLSQQTKMNLDWSVKCLQECKWNYENALTAFQTCLKNGQIPEEAFR